MSKFHRRIAEMASREKSKIILPERDDKRIQEASSELESILISSEISPVITPLRDSVI